MPVQSSFGICQLCESRVGKGAMLAHLQKCLAERGGSKASPALLIRAQAVGAPMYWLCFAVKPSATLENLDTYLRGIWLECCGHLSEFYFILGEEVSMSKKVHAILDEVGTRINYIYDWGSSTELVVRLEREVVAAPDKRVCLVARNEPPTWKCDECDEVATMVCTECHSEGDGFCCPVHAETHECGEDMLLPVVNSPRMGVCAYEGDEGEEGEE